MNNYIIQYELILKENLKLKEENDKLKNTLYIPKIVNNVFDYFIWLNLTISNAIDNFEEKP